MYKIIKDSLTSRENVVLRLSDNAYIPMDEANSDYQAFLLWKSEGNEPTPTDSE